ncbi:MAG TPA: TatD family hydrolase [Candidatus Binatia bacterium]|nr:TatD family hydrolase [Candidatus Binatia bacterium]
MQRVASLDSLPRLGDGVSLIDSHCHLEVDAFADDREAVIARAIAAGVGTMITIGASGPMQANRSAVALAAQHPEIFATVGVHPHDASRATDDALAEIERLAGQPKVVAIGETGLDFYYDNSPRAAQADAFRRQIELARRLGRPLSIHLRDAADEAARIMREEHAAEVGGVIHCFSGGPAEADVFLDLGFYLSFSGIVTFKTAAAIRAAARRTPADRLLVETDAPFLAPIPQRGRRNEPALVVYTAAALADVRGESVETIAGQTRANTVAAFRLPSA